MTLVTGSGLERFMNCRAANVLHRSFDAEPGYAALRGTEIHAYLERIANGISPEASLEQVDDHFVDACRDIDLASIADVLQLAPEVSLAYHPSTDTARVLGAALGREYTRAGVADDEVPLTVDVAGIRVEEDGRRIGIVVDFKTGYRRVTPAARNHQMRGGALALARAFDLDEVRVQLIYLREGRPAWRERATFSAFDLDMYAGELALRNRLAITDRAAYAETGKEPESTRGSWCEFCPSVHACSAIVNLVRAAASGDEFDGILRSAPLQPEVIADAWRRLRDIEKPLKLLKSTLYAAAKNHPVLLEVQPDGTELWLGETNVLGKTKIDPTIAAAVISEMVDADAVMESAKIEIIQGRLEDAIKKRVPYGAVTAKKKAVIAEIAKRGGATRPTKYDVAVHKRTPAELAKKAG